MKNILTIFLLLTCGLCFGQNLVPNPSFEVYDTCPNNGGQLRFATNWLNPISTSPDYLNGCTTGWSVPKNGYGYETARTGNAYIAIVTAHYSPFYPRSNYREYASVKLTDSLKANAKYCIRFYVSLCDSMPYSCNTIGPYISHTMVPNVCPGYPANINCYLPLIPQIENPSSRDLNSLTGWTEISGSYTAHGGESYVTIGNFRDSANSTITVTGRGLNFPTLAALYYIDDVSVSPCNSTTGQQEILEKSNLHSFPNPFSKQLTFSLTDNEQTTVTLYNFLGQQVLRQTLTNSTTINTEQLADGIYFYELRSYKGTLKTGKVVKQ